MISPLLPGKLPPELLASLIEGAGTEDPRVLVGPPDKDAGRDATGGVQGDAKLINRHQSTDARQRMNVRAGLIRRAGQQPDERAGRVRGVR